MNNEVLNMSQINILTDKDKFETTLSVENGKCYIDIKPTNIENSSESIIDYEGNTSDLAHKSTEGFGFKASKKIYHSKKEFINAPETKKALSVAKQIANKKNCAVAKKAEINTVAAKIMNKFRDPKGTEQKTTFEIITLDGSDLLLVDTNNSRSLNVLSQILKGIAIAGANDLYDVNAINRAEQDNRNARDVNRGFRYAHLYIFFLNKNKKIGIKELARVKYSTVQDTIKQ
jgi:hypothetical protein